MLMIMIIVSVCSEEGDQQELSMWAKKPLAP